MGIMSDEKVDFILKLIKENHKMIKALINYIANVSMDTEKNFNDIQKMIKDVEIQIQKLDKLKVTEHIYTDKELNELKSAMSWNELHIKTKIPVSTLQYRIRRYREKQEDDYD